MNTLSQGRRSRTLTACLFTALLLSFVLGAVAGCATMGQRGRSLVPTRFHNQVGPFTVYTGDPLQDDSPTLQQLRALERQVASSLDLVIDPSTESIEIYVLDDKEAFTRFLSIHHPDLPQRRAFFVANGEHRVVYAYRGPRLAEDLRHEAMHALLHAKFGELPLWLDEGLAEYFEDQDARVGELARLSRLAEDRSNGWKPDIQRLERMQDVRMMTSTDYRESWAWVHYVLNGVVRGPERLRAYLADCRGAGRPEPISRQFRITDADPGLLLLAHLDRAREAALLALNGHDPRTREHTRAAIVRLQDTDNSDAPEPKPADQRSVWNVLGKLAKALGVGPR